ncbi:hypothetical protein FBUS_09583 [Fasciolopsis buskii]|uniref:Mannosyltransferase n=1 Tax=Fasciolopsis buskii TaxID=27845 RepID=A0A8E0RLI0_9TREM|nr:hypothetical protein FBUS_09583 [Fasciolopsis buski]
MVSFLKGMQSFLWNRELHGFRDVCAAYFTWGIFWLMCSITADRWAYGRWTMNQWNFLRFNLLSSGSQIYGVHSWHWYLSQGLPAMLLTQIPFVFLGIYSDWSTHRRSEHRIPCRVLTILFVWTTFCYSLLGHKELRFLFPLLPVAIYLCGRGTTFLFSRFQQHPKRNVVSSALILGVLATQVPVLLYTSLVHQRGTLDAIEFIGRFVENQHHRERLDRSTKTEMWMLDPSSWHVLCLMPCHSVPSVGFLHKNITLRHLNCDPDLSRWFGESDSLMDEVDRFYAHPVAWLASEIQITNSKSKSPHVILLFDHLFKTVPQVEHLLLIGLKYRICGRFFHAHLLTHSRHGHYVLALCRSDLNN